MSSVLVVQRGHVARTSGATGTVGEQAMARRVAAEILEIGKDLHDVSPKIIDADEPNSAYRGDVFVALHGDGSANRERREASVGYRNDEGRALGQRWKALYEEGGWPFGFMRDNYTTNLARYYGTGQAVSAGNPKAIITEAGFMTNPESRAFIDSDAGTKLLAVSVIVAAYPQYDLDRLLGQAPDPPKVEDPDPPASTEPSATIITVGDTGADVKAWQADLRRLLPGSRHAHRPDGHFGPKTRAWTNEAFRELGLSASDPSRPLVGPRSLAAMEAELAKRKAAPPAPAWRGRAVRAKVDLRFYDSPRWTNPSGTMKAGHRFPTIETRLRVGGGHQYRVRNSRGAGPYYVTAASRFVDLV